MDSLFKGTLTEIFNLNLYVAPCSVKTSLRICTLIGLSVQWEPKVMEKSQKDIWRDIKDIRWVPKWYTERSKKIGGETF